MKLNNTNLEIKIMQRSKHTGSNKSLVMNCFITKDSEGFTDEEKLRALLAIEMCINHYLPEYRMHITERDDKI